MITRAPGSELGSRYPSGKHIPAHKELDGCCVDRGRLPTSSPEFGQFLQAALTVLLSSTITAENCFKGGISTFSSCKGIDTRRLSTRKNNSAHWGVKRWLMADSLTWTSRRRATWANPPRVISGSYHIPTIYKTTNTTTSSPTFPHRFPPPV